MPNIATVFKQEITRLARKEAKAQTETSRRASAQSRRDIAELKRSVQSLSKRIENLERRELQRTQKAFP